MSSKLKTKRLPRARLFCEPLETRLVPSNMLRWSDPDTWGGQVPGPGADVLIPQGQTVLLDQNTAPLANLEINGALIFDNQDLELTSKQVTVYQGRLEAGTEAVPFTHRATITLTGLDSDPHHFLNGIDIGTKGLVVKDGTLDLHGEDQVSWLKLAATADPGATQITLTDPVSWRPGDRIVVASSSVEASETETETITAVDGTDVTFAAPLRYRHWGELQTVSGFGLDERAEVGLLSHNVLVHSADDAGTAAGFGGHTMILTGSMARIADVEFDHMGQFNQMGRYPLHWHLALDSSGNYAINNSIHDSIQRGLVVHGTDNVLVQGNVVYNTVGHNIITEDGSETGNVFEANLTLVNHNAHFSFEQGDENASGFWIHGAGNTFLDNVAAGGDGSGFWFDQSRGDVAAFAGNVAHSFLRTTPYSGNGAGVVVDDPLSPTFGAAGFQGLTLHHNTQGVWQNFPANYPPNRVVIEDTRLADDEFAAASEINLSASLVIGTSAAGNTFTGVSGLVSFHDLIQTANVTWANFPPGEALRTLFGGFQGAHFIVSGSTFINASPIPGLQPGDAIFEDVDGSHFGQGYAVLVTDESMTTPDCSSRPDLGGWLCPELYHYQSLNYNAGTGFAFDFTRDDGLEVGASGQTVTLSGREYTVSANLGALHWLDLSAFPYVGDAGDWVRIVVPVGADRFRILGPNNELYQPVDSLDELNSRTDRVYFYDPDTGNLYVRIFSEGADRVVHIEDLEDSGGRPRGRSEGGKPSPQSTTLTMDCCCCCDAGCTSTEVKLSQNIGTSSVRFVAGSSPHHDANSIPVGSGLDLRAESSVHLGAGIVLANPQINIPVAERALASREPVSGEKTDPGKAVPSNPVPRQPLFSAPWSFSLSPLESNGIMDMRTNQ